MVLLFAGSFFSVLQHPLCPASIQQPWRGRTETEFQTPEVGAGRAQEFRRLLHNQREQSPELSTHVTSQASLQTPASPAPGRTGTKGSPGLAPILAKKMETIGVERDPASKEQAGSDGGRHLMLLFACLLSLSLTSPSLHWP